MFARLGWALRCERQWDVRAGSMARVGLGVGWCPHGGILREARVRSSPSLTILSVSTKIHFWGATSGSASRPSWRTPISISTTSYSLVRHASHERTPPVHGTHVDWGRPRLLHLFTRSLLHNKKTTSALPEMTWLTQSIVPRRVPLGPPMPARRLPCIAALAPSAPWPPHRTPPAFSFAWRNFAIWDSRPVRPDDDDGPSQPEAPNSVASMMAASRKALGLGGAAAKVRGPTSPLAHFVPPDAIPS